MLLKNDAKTILPLKPAGQKVALVGPYANATTQLQGNYNGPAKYVQSPLWAAEQLDWTVNYAMGTAINSTNNTGFDEALSVAKGAE